MRKEILMALFADESTVGPTNELLSAMREYILATRAAAEALEVKVLSILKGVQS